MWNDPNILHSHTCHDLYNHTPQSLDYPNQFNDDQHEIMMKDYYKHNQDKMTPDQIRELKLKTFHISAVMAYVLVCLTGILSERNWM